MIKAIVCGATGYTGLEIIKLLVKHPKVEISAISAKIDIPQKLSDIFPELKGIMDVECREMSISEMIKTGAKVAFLALPHKVSMQFAPDFLKQGIKVIDLSADFRLKDADEYKKHYGEEHSCKDYIQAGVYGLPEIYKEKIKKTQLVANPGCYPTVTLLSLAPLMSNMGSDVGEIIVDAKTGTTGAGRNANINLLHGEAAENMKAYKIGIHQHVPEIDQELSAIGKTDKNILFVPHLAPMKRGILATCYVKTDKAVDVSRLIDMYKDFYKDAPFVRVYDEGTFPQTKDVFNTNFCDIGITVSNNRIIIIGCIDNLIKGASGQAVQNMNIICGFDEALGLK